MKYIFYFLLILFSFLSSCSDNKPPVQHSDASIQSKETKTISGTIRNDLHSGKSLVYNGSIGIATDANIQVKDGYLEILLQAGGVKTALGQNIQFLKNNELNGTLSLSDAITNAVISGTIEITKEFNLRFVPDIAFNPNIIYHLTFIEDLTNREYSEKIFIAGANYCNPSGYFSAVPVQRRSNGSTANLLIKDSIFKDPVIGQVAILGWDHQTSNNFNFKINNRTPNARYKIVAAYGSYNISGHECELYLQRDANSPFPTWVDSNYASKITKVTQEDTALRNPMTKEFYSYAKTFILVKVFNSANVDITGVDTGILSLEQTDSLYGLPVSLNNEEESSLLAYLNRGNNNSYSMVLGGLIVGIFGFFLSRRLLKRKEDN